MNTNPQLNDPIWLAAAYASMSLEEVAKLLGVHRNTVRNRLIAFGLARRPKCAHFAGKEKPEGQKRKMSEARKAYWDSHPDRNSFKIKISATKTKHGLAKGYRRIYQVGIGRTREHIAVVELALGRKLLPQEQVHHINGNKLDNRLENLMVLTNSEHQKIHNAVRPRDERGRFTG